MSSPINFFNKDDPLINRPNRRERPSQAPETTSGKDFVNYLDSDSKRKKETGNREQVSTRRTQGRQPPKPTDKKMAKMTRSFEEMDALDADVAEKDEMTEPAHVKGDPFEERVSAFYRQEEPTSDAGSEDFDWFSQGSSGDEDLMVAFTEENEEAMDETSTLAESGPIYTPEQSPTPPKQAPNLLTGLTNLLARQHTESSSPTDHTEHSPTVTKETPSLFDLSATNRPPAKKTTTTHSNPIAKKEPLAPTKSITEQPEDIEEEPTFTPNKEIESSKTALSIPTKSYTEQPLSPLHKLAKEDEPIQAPFAPLTPTPLKKQQPIAELPPPQTPAPVKTQPLVAESTEPNAPLTPVPVKKQQPIAESSIPQRRRLEGNPLTDKLDIKQDRRLERKASRSSENSDVEASRQFAAQASYPAHMQNVNVNAPTPVANIQDPASHAAHIQELIDQITENAHTVKLNGDTDTFFEINSPNSVFNGARITLSTSDTAVGQFNVTIENLTQLAKNLVEMHGHQESLRTAFETKGLTLHNIFATTGSLPKEISGAQSSSNESFQNRQNQDREGESRNRERRQGQQK